MIKSVFNCPISTLFDIEKSLVYSIPRYQREYTWGRPQWERLIDDLIENEAGYYLGSIICIHHHENAFSVQNLEVVDGQQRLTTVSLLLAAVYQVLKSQPQLSVEEQFELFKLKNKLVLSKGARQARLIPQIQNSNQADYFYVLSEAEVLEEQDYPANVGNRRVNKAYWYFVRKIEEYVLQCENSSQFFQNFLEKVNAATLVLIEVQSHSDAYTLFESLNNRGIPLTAIDLIKNKLLALMEKQDPGSIDANYDKWKKVIEALGDDYNVQERFFRQYYNAYRSELKDIVALPLATKSNLMQIYEKLVTHDPKIFLNEMVRLSHIYAMITNQKPADDGDLRKALLSLERIQAAPSYLLLLILFDRKKTLQLDEKHLNAIIQSLIGFFVRRNTTDSPPTRDLTKIFIDLAEMCLSKTGLEIVQLIQSQLSEHSVSDEKFKDSLSKQLYNDNKAVCRFVLCALEEEQMTKERQLDLWEVKNKQYVWSIEHIFPQGDNIPDCWVQMMADGDEVVAQQYLNQYVHLLGNLTISGYNSSLGNKDFLEKRDRKDQQGRFVGYQNGLFLNQSLQAEECWSVEKITQRTQNLVELILHKYPLMVTAN